MTEWLVVALIPLALWTLIVAFLFILFRSEAPVEVEQEVREVDRVRDVTPGPSGLSWGPPVPSHR